jgi:hypothetical protein
MFRKTLLALAATGAVGMAALTPTTASAHYSWYGSGWYGSGYYGGYHHRHHHYGYYRYGYPSYGYRNYGYGYGPSYGYRRGYW